MINEQELEKLSQSEIDEIKAFCTLPDCLRDYEIYKEIKEVKKLLLESKNNNNDNEAKKLTNLTKEQIMYYATVE